MTEPARTFRYIGKPFPIKEDRRFVRGRGHYIADLELPGMLHLGVASAPVAHARLRGVDVEAARRAPGVVAVFTGQDLLARTEPLTQNLDLAGVAWYPLAVDKIRVGGEWTAAIVATSRAAAEDAAELVELDYEELPAVVDPEAAMAPDAPLVHDSMGTNIAWQNVYTWGDVDGAFAGATHTFHHRYRWNRHAGVPLETFGTVAAVDPASGILDLWASQQTPAIQQDLSHVLRLPSHQIRVHQDVDVGGSYGAKRGRKQMCLVAAAALFTGHPVRFIEDRRENMTAGDSHGPDRVFDIKLAVDGDGRVRAIDVSVIDDIGTYAGRGALQIGKPITAVVGPYRIDAVRYGGYAVVTNKTNQEPFRGAGMAAHNFVLERSFDRIARALDIDRVELRRRNYIPTTEFPYTIPSGSTYDSGDFFGAMDLAMKTADLPGLQAEQAAARARGKLVGIGIAGGLEPSGGHQSLHEFMSPFPTSPIPEAARIQVDQAGRVVTTIGFQSAGQSHESMVTQIVCEELGVVPADVTVQRRDSLAGIVGSAAMGSRMTLMLGTALVRTAEKIRAKARRIAAHVLEADVADVAIDGSRYYVVGAPSRELQLTEIASIAYRQPELMPADEELGLVEGAVFTGFGPGKHLQNGRLQFGFPSYAFSIHIPVVEVDPDTLQVTITRYLVVHDCGQVINPLAVNGLLYGGIAHGIGAALYEQWVYDQNGQMLNASLMDYLLPTAGDVPRIELHEQITPSPLHPYGSKGTAEGGYLTAPAAVASAVEDALAPLGIEIEELPMTPRLLSRLIANPSNQQGWEIQRLGQ